MIPAIGSGVGAHRNGTNKLNIRKKKGKYDHNSEGTIDGAILGKESKADKADHGQQLPQSIQTRLLSFIPPSHSFP